MTNSERKILVNKALLALSALPSQPRPTLAANVQPELASRAVRLACFTMFLSRMTEPRYPHDVSGFYDAQGKFHFPVGVVRQS